MKVATWNVNSVRAREARLLSWLEREHPDVLCLQETKVADEDFPYESVVEYGYHLALNGQKGSNGVAILSRAEPTAIERGMGADDDPQARLLSAVVAGVRVLSAYIPAGLSVGSDEYEYKLDWMRRLRDHLEATASPSDPLILAGDFNVAPDDLDVAYPELWGGSVMCHPTARDALEGIREWGLIDVFRRHHPEGGVYSWWDYQMRAFDKGDGLRIDHIFATEVIASRSASARIDRAERAGGRSEKPSDHAPVVVEFAD